VDVCLDCYEKLAKAGQNDPEITAAAWVDAAAVVFQLSTKTEGGVRGALEAVSLYLATLGHTSVTARESLVSPARKMML
jgi:hypothetical protein